MLLSVRKSTACLFFFAIVSALAISEVRSQHLVNAESLLRTGNCPSSDNTSIQLLDAVYGALCNNPKTYRYYASIRLRVEELNASKSVLAPHIDVNWKKSGGTAALNKSRVPSDNYSARINADEKEGEISWLIFDSGKSNADIRKARSLLSAEVFAQDASYQKIIFDAAQLYYSLVTGQGSVAAFKETVKNAHESLAAATAKYKGGVGTLSDKLQAETAYQQARLDESKSQVELEKIKNSLAILMGRINTDIRSFDAELPVPVQDFDRNLESLLSASLLEHPDIRAAQEQLEAADSNVKSAGAQGRPMISIVASVSEKRTNGLPPSDFSSRGTSIGLQLTIPIYEGGLRSAEIGIAKAKRDIAEMDLIDAKKRIANDLLDSYKKLSSQTRDIDVTGVLLDTATRSYEIARGRYNGGVGSILELLAAQNALSNARQLRIQTLANWNISRLELLMNMGRLDINNLNSASNRY